MKVTTIKESTIQSVHLNYLIDDNYNKRNVQFSWLYKHAPLQKNNRINSTIKVTELTPGHYKR